MIGVDTNVLVRLFIVEDTPQTARAVAFFAERSPDDPAYISLVVVAEFAWVLKRRYKYSYDRIGAALQGLLDSDDFVVERREVVEWSLSQFDRAKVDFSDLMISRTNLLADCTSTVTFDHDASRFVAGMTLLK
jgi:predicted nucleic-acid-binding protein